MPSFPTDLPVPDVVPGPVNATPLPTDRPVRWGIIATGKIAKAFAANLRLLPDAEIAAVGARRLESAQEFASQYDVGSAYGSYDALLEDPQVDVVYVASPHALHKEHVLAAFAAAKPVLCEKALTLTADDAEDLVAAARAKGLFLMEGMWMRCNPLIRRLGRMLDTGEFGRIRQIRADLGFVVDKPPTDRLLDRALGGGVLLDMGVYPLAFAQLFLGEPSEVAAVASLTDAGVDQNLALSLGFPDGAVAALTASMTGWTPRTASIATDRGRFDLPNGFHHPTTATWTALDGDPDFDEAAGSVQISEDVIGTGLANEAAEVIRCLRSGETESPLVPLADTVALLRLTDRIRAQIGVRYDGDR